ncbi:hypothetical protein Bbelb_197040 [Branchiostoma belcheri]|nr:hypothetical protein Bbelb_197040 [Branchiostoma belcheri]
MPAYPICGEIIDYLAFRRHRYHDRRRTVRHSVDACTVTVLSVYAISMKSRKGLKLLVSETSRNNYRTTGSKEQNRKSKSFKRCQLYDNIAVNISALRLGICTWQRWPAKKTPTCLRLAFMERKCREETGLELRVPTHSTSRLLFERLALSSASTINELQHLVTEPPTQCMSPAQERQELNQNQVCVCQGRGLREFALVSGQDQVWVRLGCIVRTDGRFHRSRPAPVRSRLPDFAGERRFPRFKKPSSLPEKINTAASEVCEGDYTRICTYGPASSFHTVGVMLHVRDATSMLEVHVLGRISSIPSSALSSSAGAKTTAYHSVDTSFQG